MINGFGFCGFFFLRPLQMATYVTWPPSGGGGPATELDTTGAAVNVGNSGPPVVGQILVATNATNATWQYPEIFGLKFGDVLTSQNITNTQAGSLALGAGVVTMAAQNSTAIGYGAGVAGTGQGSVVVGYTSYSEGSNAIVIGRSTYASSAATDGISIGRFAAVADADAIAIGRNSVSNFVEGIAIGRASIAGGTHAVAIGYSANGGGIDGVAIGDLAVSTTYAVSVGANSQVNQSLGVAIGNLSKCRSSSGGIAIGSNAQHIVGSASVGRAIVIGADSSITVGNVGTCNNSLILGVQTTASVTDGNMNSAVIIGPSTTVTGSGTGSANNATIVGHSNTFTRVDGAADNCQIFGQGNTLTTTSGAVSRTTMVGRGNTFNNTTAAATNNEIYGSENTINGGCVQNLVLGRSNTVSASVSYSTTIGSGLTNGTSESILMGTNSNTLMTILPAATGNFTHLRLGVVFATTTVTLTASDILGGLVTSTSAGTATFTLPTAADMNAHVSITQNLYTGLCFFWVLYRNNASNNVTVVTNTDHTVAGTGAAIQPLIARIFLTRRGGSGSWVTYMMS